MIFSKDLSVIWKVKDNNIAVLDVESAAHLEAFSIKQGMLFLSCLCFRHVLRHVLRHVGAIACLICQSLHIYNRQLWTAEMIFTLVFLIFLKTGVDTVCF